MTNFSKGFRKDKDGKVGVNKDPEIKFDINGGFKCGSPTTTEVAGMIRWNSEEKKYQWFDGIGWYNM